MLNFGNKEFRNLEEQVLKNQKDIEKLQTGIKIEKYLLSESDLVEYLEFENVGKYYLVSESDGKHLYIIATRKNGGLIATDLGLYPKAEKGEQGVPGQTGEKGEKGDRGERGADGYPGPRGAAGQGWRSLSTIDSFNYSATTTPVGNYLNMHTYADLITDAGTPVMETKDIELKLRIPKDDTKLDKRGGTYSVYGKMANGNDGLWSLSYDKAEGSIPIRGVGGVINVGIPVSDNNAATKKYVDDAVAGAGGGEKLYKQIVKYYMDDVEFGKFMFITTKPTVWTPGLLQYPEDYGTQVRKVFVVDTMQTGPNPDTDFIVTDATELLYELDYMSSILNFYPAGYKGSGTPYQISFPTWADATLLKIEEV